MVGAVCIYMVLYMDIVGGETWPGLHVQKFECGQVARECCYKLVNMFGRVVYHKLRVLWFAFNDS